MLQFLKAPFLVLHFSYYTWMTFLTMLSVILLSMMMMLHSILIVIRHLICGNNLNWLLNLNLIYEILWTGSKKWFVDFSAGKTQLVLFVRFGSNAAIDVKMSESVFEEKSPLKMLGLTYLISIPKTAFKKIETLICSLKFLSPQVALHLWKSTICPCMEYCCHIWPGIPSCYLELLGKIQNQICGAVGPSLASFFPWIHVSSSKCDQLKPKPFL